MKYLEYRDSSDRLVIAIEGLPSMAYRFVRWKLCRRFGLRKSDTYIKDLDSKFQTFNRADEQLSIDWDAWSGFMVVALNPGSENLAKELGMWLKEKYID